jgi:hypothetical protein
MQAATYILAELLDEFLTHPHHAGLLEMRAVGGRNLTRFIADYPVHDAPAKVSSVIRTRSDAMDFVRRLETDLRSLGGINLRGNRPVEEAGRNLDEFKRLLERVVDPQINVWKRIDGDWNIAGFGGESRQIAKKMVNTYYPEETLPIFNTEHGEHFVRYLRIDKDLIARELYDRRYASLFAPSEIWHVLSEALFRVRGQVQSIRDEDNVYLMYCLYYSRACPRNFRPGLPGPR